MTAFKASVGKKPRQKDSQPKERKPVHPGLLRLAREVHCRKCGTFLSWSALGVDSPLSVSGCECGLWIMDLKGQIRWIRFASAPVVPGIVDEPLYAP